MQQYIDLLPDYMPQETAASPTLSQKASTQNTSSVSKNLQVPSASATQATKKKLVNSDVKKSSAATENLNSAEKEERKKAAANSLQEMSNL
jgi:hypothetical protein